MLSYYADGGDLTGAMCKQFALFSILVVTSIKSIISFCSKNQNGLTQFWYQPLNKCSNLSNRIKFTNRKQAARTKIKTECCVTICNDS